MPQFRPARNLQSQISKKHITHFVIMGDSLSDRSTFAKRKLFGLIPLGPISGLDQSPRGRFTNGYTWSDDASNWFVEDALIRDFIKTKKLSFSDIADAVITNEDHIKSIIKSWYNLDNDKSISIRSKEVVRSFAEGGATSFDYSWHISSSIKRFFTRLIVSTLGAKRSELIKDDAQRNTSLKEKRHTLVVEWTGANDLITVNKEPSYLEADRAVAARIKNVKELIRQGYYNFALFGLPDLSLTPRFQRLDDQAQENAKNVSEYFNQKLKDEIDILSTQFPHCSIDYFNVNKYFKEAYADPAGWGFKPELKKTPFIKSDDFELYNLNQSNNKNATPNKDNEVSPSEGYMFWDDVHPTAAMHAKIAEFFYNKYSKKYNLEFNLESKEIDIPSKKLYDIFKKQYEKTSNKEFNSFFGCFRSQNLPKKLSAVSSTFPSDKFQEYLNVIFDHALNDKGQRTLRVLEKLGWIVDGSVIPVKALKLAFYKATKTPILDEQENTKIESSEYFGAPQKSLSGAFEI